jgi:HK97 family phage prohead protease
VTIIAFEQFDHTFAIKSIDSQHRIIKGTASLEEVDRDGEIIAMEAFKGSLTQWLENPVIRYKHSDPVGKGIPSGCYIDEGTKQFIVTAQLSDKTDKAREAWGLIEDGIIKSFSVGGKVLEKMAVKGADGKEVNKITKMELYEVSIVDIPSNRKSFFTILAKSIKAEDQGFHCSKCDKIFDTAQERDDHETECTKAVKGSVDDRMAQQIYHKPYSELTPEQQEHVDAEIENLSNSAKPTDTKGADSTTTSQGVSNNKEETKMPIENATENKSVEPKIEMSKEIMALVDSKVAEAISKMPVYKAQKEEMAATVASMEPMTGIQKFATFSQPFDYGEAMKSVQPETGEFYSGLNGAVDKRAGGATFKAAYDAYIQKFTSTSTGGAGTAGYALIPVYVDPDIIDRTRREIPFIEMLPRRAVQGLTYDYNAITTLTNAVTLNEDASLDDLTDVYDRFSVAMTYLYSTGRVSGPSIAARKGYVDALNLEVQNRTIGLKRYEDKLCLQTAATAPEMSSLADLILTNETALGGPLTVSALRTEIAQCRDAGGVPNVLVTTNTLLNSLKGLMMDYQRYVDTTKIAWGIETMSFDGIPVIVDRYTPTGYVYILDMSVIFMAVLQDMVYEELAKTNDSVKFTLKAYEALVCRAEAFNSILTGCT